MGSLRDHFGPVHRPSGALTGRGRPQTSAEDFGGPKPRTLRVHGAVQTGLREGRGERRNAGICGGLRRLKTPPLHPSGALVIKGSAVRVRASACPPSPVMNWSKGRSLMARCGLVSAVRYRACPRSGRCRYSTPCAGARLPHDERGGVHDLRPACKASCRRDCWTRECRARGG